MSRADAGNHTGLAGELDGYALGAVTFAVTAAFVPFIASASTTPRWAAACLIPICFRLRPITSPALVFGRCFLGYAFLSLLWASNPVDGVGALLQIMICACAFILGGQIKDLTPAMHGFALGLMLSAVFALLQVFYDPRIVPTVFMVPAGSTSLEAVTGLFFASQACAETTALGLVAVLAYRKWAYAPLLLAVIYYGHSRTAWVGLAAAALWALRKQWKYIAIPLLVVGAAIFFLPRHSTSTAERWDIYWDAISGLSFLGSGVGSFQTAFPYHASRIDIFTHWVEHAHSDVLELIYEFGIGSVLALAFIAACLWRGAERDRAILVAFLAIAVVDNPLHFPTTAFVAALVAGHLGAANVGLHSGGVRWRANLQRRAAAA